ncbi:MAG TPA: hypothetical protein DEO84_08365 [candidate division Zixibacteria bacterium]|nr:hypothetical protein [candidate division Zixibacteria bacterium]
MDEIKEAGGLLSVNWEDGMLIKASHFVEQEKYFEELGRWVVKHGPHYFGITGLSAEHTSSLEIRIDHDGQGWLVVLSKCYALTASGKIVQIDSRFNNEVKTTLISAQGGATTISVYIHCQADKRGVGLPSGDSEPTRYPYRAMRYELVVGELRGGDPADCVKIAEIKFSDNRPAISADYIPPCMVIGAYPHLAENCRRLYGMLKLVQQSAISGFQAFVATGQDKPGKFGIEHKWFQDMLSALAIDLGGRLGGHPVPEQPITPYDLVTYYKQVFGTVEAMLETYREASLTLKKKFAANEAYSRFVDGIKEFIGTPYNHHELGIIVSRLIRLMNDFVEFVNMVGGLAGALPQVGLVISYRNREYKLQPFGSVISSIERDSVTVKIEGIGSAVSRDLLIGINRELFSGVDYRYIMVKIGINENNIPGRMDPVYVDVEASSGNLILKPMDDLAAQSISAINLNFRGNFNIQDLKTIANEMVNVYIY